MASISYSRIVISLCNTEVFCFFAGKCPFKKVTVSYQRFLKNEFVLEILYIYNSLLAFLPLQICKKNSASMYSIGGSMHFWHFQSAQCHGVARFTDD